MQVQQPPVNTKHLSKEKQASRVCASFPYVNIDEDEKEYTLYVAIPSMEKEDLEITVENNELRMDGRIAKVERMYKGRCEYSLSNWQRSFSLPAGTNGSMSSAHYANGELIIRVPKGYSDDISKPAKIYIY